MSRRSLHAAITAVVATVALIGCTADNNSGGGNGVGGDGGDPEVELAEVNVAELDPSAGRPVELEGNVDGAARFPVETIKNLGDGKALVAAFIHPCATVAGVELGRADDVVLVDTSGCEPRTADEPVDTVVYELVQVEVPTPPGYTFPEDQ